MRNALAYAALIVAFVGGIAASDTHRAKAQTRNAEGEFCAPAESLMQKANDLFHEQVKWTGKNAMGYRFVLMASANTWTFIMIDKSASEDGTFEGCVKASDGQPPADAGDHS
jgi:hypothetical protein